MAKAIIILAVIATAYSAVIKNEGVLLQRVARSPCSTCGPPPPPPPPLLRTQNWSGLARSSDGLQNTVFSGAAAAAADQGPLAGGEAFSLASSSAGAGQDGSANSGSTGSGSSGSGSSSLNGASFERSFGANYGGYSSVKGGAAGGYGGGQKVSGGFKESHHSYHSEGSKDFGAQGEFRQDGQAAASNPSSFVEQGGSFGSNNKDVGFGGNHGGHSGAFRDRGDGNVEETQNQYKGSFSGHRNNQHLEGHGSSEQLNRQQDGKVKDFNAASSSGQSSSFGGNRGGVDGHFEHGFSSENQRQEGSLSDKTENGRGSGHFGSGFSSGQEIREGNSFGSAVGQGNFGSGFSNNAEGSAAGFGGNSDRASQGHFESGFPSEGKRKQFKEQARYRPHGSQKQGRGFEASDSQSSSSQGGLGSGQYQGSAGNQGQLQASSGSGFGQAGFGSGSLASSGQQGYVRGSGSSDAQSALSGALNLASQGLQTSSQAGCTTCGKSSYALSNAKSRSGSAVAVSIGG